MNFTLEPADQCITVLEENLLNPVKWLGFDKFKKIVYGVRKQGGKRSSGTEFVMRSIFGGAIKIIATFRFKFKPPYVDLSKICKLSCGGDYIGFVFQRPKITTKFYLISIESGKIQFYNFVPSPADAEDFILLHSTKVEWIVVYQRKMFQLILNDAENKCHLECLTGVHSEFLDTPEYFATEKILYAFSRSLDFVYVYEFESKTLEKKELEDCPKDIKKQPCRLIVGSVDCQTAFAVPRDLLKGDPAFYQLVEYHWEKSQINLNVQCGEKFHHYTTGYQQTEDGDFIEMFRKVKRYYRILNAFCSSDLLVFQMETNPIVEDSKSEEDVIAKQAYTFFVNTNVLSLQNLAFKRIYASFGKEQILEMTKSFPTLLNRQYFAPVWAQKVVSSAQTVICIE